MELNQVIHCRLASLPELKQQLPARYALVRVIKHCLENLKEHRLIGCYRASASPDVRCPVLCPLCEPLGQCHDYLARRHLGEVNEVDLTGQNKVAAACNIPLVERHGDVEMRQWGVAALVACLPMCWL